MTKIQFLALVSGLMVHCFAFANPDWLTFNEVNIKFGGWSHHVKGVNDRDYQYNESHNGLGAELNFNLFETPNHLLTAGFWKMTDSHYRVQRTAGVGYVYRFDTPLIPYLQGMDANVILSYYDRSKRVIHQDDPRTATIESWEFIAPTPHLTLRFNQHFNLDLFYIPNGVDRLSPKIYFIRAGIALDKDTLSGLFID